MTATAKDIVLKQIDSRTANALVRKLHYSGKVDTRSQIHIGVFLNGILEGAMQFGPSLDKRKSIGLVAGTLWHEYIDLHRLAFSDKLPRNSESRALSIAMRLLRKYAPQLKWVLSYADGSQCGDGTIYRAAGFVLTAITENKSMYLMPDGEVCCKIIFEPGFQPNPKGKSQKDKYGKTGGETAGHFLARIGAKPIPGFQLRYIYFLDPAYRARLTVPELPYSEIERRGAKMYKGQRPGGEGETDSAAGSNLQTEGASPISPLSKVEA